MQPLAGIAAASVESATSRLNVWEGSVRSGKTIASLIAWLDYAYHCDAGDNLLMAGKTERTLRRNVIDPLTDMLGRRRCRLNTGTGELYLFSGSRRRRVYIVGANNEMAQEKIRGVTLKGAYVDEATTLPESFWKMLLSRLSAPGARLFATTNPDTPLHWLAVDYLERAALHLESDGTVRDRREELADDPDLLDLARFSFRIEDNPHLEPAYVQALKREYAGLWYLRFIEGKWVAAEGAIWDMLDPTPGGRHVVRELPKDLTALMIACDYGTTNPFVALLLGVSREERRLYVCREWRWDSAAKHRQMTDAEYSQELTAWLGAGADGFAEEAQIAAPLPIDAWVVDPSAASFRQQLQRDGWGWSLKADNAVNDGLRDVATLLKADRARIHESCTGLLREAAGYTWDPAATKRGEEAPLKQNDHGPDAWRYGVRAMRRLWRPWVILTEKEVA